MARPAGAKSQGHEQRREALLAKLQARLVQRNAMHASYRELAEAAGVSISTLQHYFGRREDIVAAILARAHAQSTPFLAVVRESAGTFADSIADLVAYVRSGFEDFGVGDLHALGLSEGLRHGSIGPQVVDAILEPSIDAVAARLNEHQRRGEMRPADARFAALQLLGPLVLGYLHQRDLDGALAHAFDMDDFARELVTSFVRAHQV
jgi:AcrR family transcriptional regulator